MNAIGWGSLGFQTAALIVSAHIQSRIKPPGAEMIYFAKQTRRYYLLARAAFYFQAGTLVAWIIAMMHSEGTR